MRGDKSLDTTLRELIFEDCYQLAMFPQDHFDTIIDIGANIGIFSLLSRIRNPNAKILTVEPSISTFEMLQENLYGLNCIEENAALGDGTPLRFIPNKDGRSRGDVFVTGNEQVEGAVVVPSYRFTELLSKHGLECGPRTLVKIDCEGGERHFLEDATATEYLTRARYIALELHYEGTFWDDWPQEIQNFLLPGERYREWIDATFHSTHRPLRPPRLNNPRGHGTCLLVTRQEFRRLEGPVWKRALKSVKRRVRRTLRSISPNT